MNFRPLGDRVLVLLSEVQERTESGLIIPQMAQEKSNRGTVVAVGPGRVTEHGRLIEPHVKRGDVVLLPKYAGTEIELGGKKHLVLAEEEIIGVVDNS